MFENVQIFLHLHLKYAKSVEKYQYGYQKNAEFNADFKFVDAGFRKYP
jgi:hypothetical protein